MKLAQLTFDPDGQLVDQGKEKSTSPKLFFARVAPRLASTDDSSTMCLFGPTPQNRNQTRTYLLNQSIVRCQAKSAAALLYRSGVASQLKPCTAPG